MKNNLNFGVDTIDLVRQFINLPLPLSWSLLVECFLVLNIIKLSSMISNVVYVFGMVSQVVQCLLNTM